jgi:hypothetical protein
VKFSPRAWGWSAHAPGRSRCSHVLPTRVGMVRPNERRLSQSHRSPHARGDGPMRLVKSPYMSVFSTRVGRTVSGARLVLTGMVHLRRRHKPITPEDQERRHYVLHDRLWLLWVACGAGRFLPPTTQRSTHCSPGCGNTGGASACSRVGTRRTDDARASSAGHLGLGSRRDADLSAAARSADRACSLPGKWPPRTAGCYGARC